MTHINYIIFAPEYIFIFACLICIGLYLKSKWILIASTIIFMMLLCFFRPWNGKQVNHVDPTTLYCPCDGIVKDIKIINNKIQIIIFLNVHNIHVQYTPFNCQVTSIRYHKGTFHPAYILEKSQYNERMEYTLTNEYFGPITFIQIAGQLARRIVSFVSKNQQLQSLDPLGLIKFGSRCDIIVPLNCNRYNIMIQQGQRVHIGDELIRISKNL